MANGWFNGVTPLIIGHRGASADAPENTLRAFRLARLQGADGIELDVHLAADGVPVVIHDATLQRTTGTRGRVAEWTSAALGELDAGLGESIPTLDRVFDEFEMAPEFLINVEIKERTQRQACVEAVRDLIARHKLTTRTLISSFDPVVMRLAEDLVPQPTALALLRVRLPRAQRRCYFGRAEHPNFAVISRQYMRWAQAHNLHVNAWTVDDPKTARRLLERGVHGIITNRPGALRGELGL